MGSINHPRPRLQARLKPLTRKTQPYAKKVAHRGIWVEPNLLAEIEYRAKSAEGKLRHLFFKGLGEVCDGRFRPLLARGKEAFGKPLTIPAELHERSSSSHRRTGLIGRA